MKGKFLIIVFFVLISLMTVPVYASNPDFPFVNSSEGVRTLVPHYQLLYYNQSVEVQLIKSDVDAACAVQGDTEGGSTWWDQESGARVFYTSINDLTRNPDIMNYFPRCLDNSCTITNNATVRGQITNVNPNESVLMIYGTCAGPYYHGWTYAIEFKNETYIEPPIPSFNATPETGYPPLTVAFNDTSTPGTNPITSWLWDFNDYSQSNHPSNASHTFLMNGTYNVTMTVGDGVGEYTAFKNITVGEAPAIPGSYDLTVHVKDSAGVHIEGAHISLLVSNGTVLTNYTNAVGISNFIAVPGSAAAIIDVTKAGYAEYIETFTIASSFTKEVTISQSGVKFYVDVKDSIYGSYLNNIDFGVKNTTSGVWRNVSNRPGALYVDSTGLLANEPLSIGQTVIVAASKAGYRSDWDSITLTQAEPPLLVTLQLVNINGSAPSSGNFTGVIALRNGLTGVEIPGGSVTINELGRMASTNGAGVAMFYNVPVGSYSLLASATGYPAVTDDITGTDQETVMKSITLLPTGYVWGPDPDDPDGPPIIIDPDGNPYQPWNPDYDPDVPGATEANDRAADAITSFLDNAVGIAGLVFILLLFWFVKKIFLT